MACFYAKPEYVSALLWLGLFELGFSGFSARRVAFGLALACASTLHSPNLPFPHSTCPLRHSVWAWGGNPSRQANQAKSPQAAFMRLAEHKWAARRINTAYWGAAQRAQKLRRSRHKTPKMLWFTLVLVCMICRAWLLGLRRLCLACGFRGAFFRFA